MNKFEKNFLHKLINKNKSETYNDKEYPLIDNPFDSDDLMSAISVYYLKEKSLWLKLQKILKKNLPNM